MNRGDVVKDEEEPGRRCRAWRGQESKVTKRRKWGASRAAHMGLVRHGYQSRLLFVRKMLALVLAWETPRPLQELAVGSNSTFKQGCSDSGALTLSCWKRYLCLLVSQGQRPVRRRRRVQRGRAWVSPRRDLVPPTTDPLVRLGNDGGSEGERQRVSNSRPKRAPAACLGRPHPPSAFP